MHLYTHRKAVSNVLGFVFSFSIIATLSSFAVLQTGSYIDDSKHQAAALEAQNVANQVADAMVNAVTVSQSLPNAQYYGVLDVPDKLAGYDYNISMDNDAIYVYTKDGEVRKSCPNYNTKNVPFNIRGVTSGGVEGVTVAYNPPDFLYHHNIILR